MTNHPHRNRRATKIVPQMCAQGSYGLCKINHVNGVRIGNVITVWHVMRDGQRIGSYLTREQARDAARE